jgi:hypothetical protein
MSSSQTSSFFGEPGSGQANDSANEPPNSGHVPLGSFKMATNSHSPSSSSLTTNTGSASATTSESADAAQRQQMQQHHVKRTRILLSCAPCRTSKLRCDRGQPCSMCVKKERTDGCLYAPRPEKARPAKSMAARLKRLEGMVRGMMPGEGSGSGLPGGQLKPESGEFALGRGQVVVNGRKTTTYVGATHFMAMLDDVSPCATKSSSCH